jgi:two-component sensor histidine kinase
MNGPILPRKTVLSRSGKRRRDRFLVGERDAHSRIAPEVAPKDRAPELRRAAPQNLAGHDQTAERHLDPVRDKLLRELNHRLRNVFPTVLTILKHTAAYYPEAADFRDALERRLRALSAAIGLVNHRKNGSVDLRDLVRLELKAFQNGANVVIRGPSILIQPVLVQDLAIVLHELTTNAVKYGALSEARGKLSVAWNRMTDADGKDLVVLKWIEQGGPPTKPPKNVGFGMSVVKESGSLLGGTSLVEFAPEGLRYRLSIPAERVLGFNGKKS